MAIIAIIIIIIITTIIIIIIVFIIIIIIDCNWTRTQNHLVLKRTLNHLAKLVDDKILDNLRYEKQQDKKSSHQTRSVKKSILKILAMCTQKNTPV